MTGRLVVAAFVTCGLLAAPAAAQSLADVARQEEARRKTAKKAVRSLSNADLAPSEIAFPAPAVPDDCIMSASQGKCAPPEEVIAKSESAATQADPQVKTSEATIRGQATRIRERLLKAQQEFDAITRTADDDARSPGERAAAARLAAQRESIVASIEDQWRALEQQVADEGLPRQWLGVTPILSTRIPQ